MSKINTRVVVWTVVIVVVVVGLVWYVVGTQKPVAPPAPITSSTPQQTIPGVNATYAPQGQVVSGFPKSLILDTAAAVSNSYTINYASSGNQYTAQWNSSSSMASLYASYKKYLPANGWTIVNDITKYTTSRGLYATSPSSTVGVAIVAQGSGAQVTVSYLIQ